MFIGAAFVVGAIAYLLVPSLIVLVGVVAISGISAFQARRRARRDYLLWAAAQRNLSRQRYYREEETTEVLRQRAPVVFEDELRRAKEEAGGIWP